MVNYSKLTIKTKEQIKKYFKTKSDKLPAHISRTLTEIGYGLLTSGNTLLTEIARTLNEKTNTKKIVERLRKNIADPNLQSVLEEEHLKRTSCLINKDSVIPVDDGEIIKKFGKNFEGLSKVHDGSTNTIEKGFPILSACLTDTSRSKIIPLLSRLYSYKEDSFYSRNFTRAIFFKKLIDTFGKLPTYVFDRGFSEHSNLQRFQDVSKYVCRALDRRIKYKGKSYLLYEWKKKIKLKYGMIVESIENGKIKKKDTAFEVFDISTKGLKLSAVVMQISGHGRCVLFTNQQQDKKSNYNFGKKIIKQYGARWTIEEEFRFEKQEFKLENIRLRNLTALKNMVTVVMLTSAFVSNFSMIGQVAKNIAPLILEQAKSIRDRCRFQGYRFAEGIKIILRRRNKPPYCWSNKKPKIQQFFFIYE